MEYPRVTEVLRPFSFIHNVARDVLAKAAERGSTVHALCASTANGAWVPATLVDEEFRGYIKSFNLWASAQVEEFRIVEKRFTSETFQYTGQLDFVVQARDGNLYLVDIKTSSSHQKTYALQMAAYHGLLLEQGIVVKAALLVYLDKEGGFPKIYVVEELDAQFLSFQACLKCYYYFKIRNENVRKVKYSSEDSRNHVRA